VAVRPDSAGRLTMPPAQLSPEVSEATTRRGERVTAHTWPNTIASNTGWAAATMLPSLAGGFD
jgi:hypothetical protein